MLVPMSKERFVERMLADANRKILIDKERQRRLKFELQDYLSTKHNKRAREMRRHERYYR